MKPNAKWGIAGLILGVVVALMLPTVAQESPSPDGSSTDRTVTTTGTAIVRSSPDEALVTLGVRTDAATAEKAMDDNAQKMSDVIDALKAAGLDERDLATASINLYPQWDTSGTSVVGFTAENQLTATVHDLDRVGAIIDRGVAAGANIASGITFQISDANAAADQALDDAVANARHKAELLAGAADAQLGAVVSITELSSTVEPPVVYAAADSAGGAATPVLPPTLESQVSVSVVWSLA
jgi:uncharacterized protein YggE